MATYVVSAVGHITLVTEVEANSAEEAKEKAAQRGVTGLCHGAELDRVDDVWVTTGELDCIPQPDDIVDCELKK